MKFCLNNAIWIRSRTVSTASVDYLQFVPENVSDLSGVERTGKLK